MSNKTGVWIIGVVFVFLLPWIIYLASFKAVALDINFYADEFDKYDTGVEGEIEITADLLYFLRNKDANQSYIADFTEDEKNHLLDVKNLMQKYLFFSYMFSGLFLIVLFGLYNIDKKKFIKHLGAGISLGGVLALIFSLIDYLFLRNFDWAFTRFHELFFEGNWQFASNSLLIKLFPEQFWIDISSKLITSNIIIASILIVVGIIMLIVIKGKR